MMEMGRDVIVGWNRLPGWMRREICRSSRRGWVYSGDSVIGWNWVIGYVGCGEIISDDVVYFMEYIGGLIGGGEFRGIFVGGEEVIKIKYILPGGEEMEGNGVDRLVAFYDLLYCVGEWYWENYCPSLRDLGLMTSVGGFEIGEGLEGIWIYFEEYIMAREFMKQWSRFILEGSEDLGGERVMHGRLKMMEGDFWIYSGCAEGGKISGGGVFGEFITVSNLDGWYRN